MATRSSITAARLTAMGTGLCLLASCAACGAEPAATTDETQETASSGAVAVFTPSDGITISQRTPLSKWAKFVPELTEQLTALGMDKADIETSTADGLDRQSRQVQDWVVSHMTDDEADEDDGTDPEDTTIIVAPAVESDDATRQYGDYATRPRAKDDASSADEAERDADGTDASSSDAAEAADETSAEDEEDAVERLVSALRLARSAGMHVILLANGVEGFKPDAFVSMSTAEQIGRTQAAKLVAKLDLAKTDEQDPQAIELLIPHSPEDATATDTDEGTDAGTSEGSGEGDDAADEATNESDAFARKAFAGAWQVLQPYFTQGKAYSPSGLLTKDTTDDDWRDVTVDATDAASIAKALDERLLSEDAASPASNAKDAKDSKTSKPARIDGVIAMNDYVASAVIEELTSLGYVGSSADVNPSISISDIVGGIAGRKDLARKAVPEPSMKADVSDDAATAADGDGNGNEQDDTDDTAWPVITGFGGYVDTMPQVVNGKQWMTGLENRVALAADTAQVAVRLNQGEELKDLSYVSRQTVDGVEGKVNVVGEELLAVSASNLKTALIDPGYITMAEAGL